MRTLCSRSATSTASAIGIHSPSHRYRLSLTTEWSIKGSLEFDRHLKELGPDIWSLRCCPVCKSPFLCRREDKKACTSKCNDTLRKRRSRSQSQAEAND